MNSYPQYEQESQANSYRMTPNEFIKKWHASELKESSASQEHFLDLCRLLDEPTPAEADPQGQWYCFERGTQKDSGGDGWADVWKRHHFAWEYKGKGKNLTAAFNQLRQYALALENPPLLIVSDMTRIQIRTNWTNSVSELHEITLDDLADASIRNKLKWALSDPQRLQPGITRQKLTERAAQSFAALAQALRTRGHDPQEVAHFVNRLVFCMFAEDVGLLPANLFTRMLEHSYKQPEQFSNNAKNLFGAMATKGGMVGFEPVAWFNGGLFGDDRTLPLERDEIEIALKAAALDWADIDPSIFGVLFERGLDPDKRSQLGAHYTDRDKIMQIVEPVISQPLIAEWNLEKAKIAAILDKQSTTSGKLSRRPYNTASQRLRKFLTRLRSFVVLDPACGSGNFLYVALHALKDIEHRILLEAEALGLQREFHTVGPVNVKGIEINHYAAELARVSVWIGHIQWMRRNGFSGATDPVLEPLDNIECRDAILTTDDNEPEWPKADVVIGNPPFLGGKLLRSRLGDKYVEALQRLYGERIHGEADLVCHWFDKASRLVFKKKLHRVGLVATNSIRGGRNRSVLDKVVETGVIYDAWSDDPWVVDGAAVRVSIVCFGPKAVDYRVKLNGMSVQQINSDLVSGAADLTKVRKLSRNENIAFMGDVKGGSFDISGNLARKWLALPINPNGRSNSDVLKPWVNGMDITRRPASKWIIDFGFAINESEASLFERPYNHICENVKPSRQMGRNKHRAKYWWRHISPGPKKWQLLDGLSRYIATPRVAKHRLFVWLDASICPDCQLIVFAREDDTTIGILHSRFHEAWSLRLGTSLEDRPRYTPTTTFLTFPFPEGLSPDISADEYADVPHAVAIADSARRLVELRDRWLNPPDLVKWVDEPVAGYPQRPEPRSENAANTLKKRTLTNLYNDRPKWLLDAHASLDAAVADAYGWDPNITEEEFLQELIAINLSKN